MIIVASFIVISASFIVLSNAPYFLQRSVAAPNRHSSFIINNTVTKGHSLTKPFTLKYIHQLCDMTTSLVVTLEHFFTCKVDIFHNRVRTMTWLHNHGRRTKPFNCTKLILVLEYLTLLYIVGFCMNSILVWSFLFRCYFLLLRVIKIAQ